MTNLPEQLEKFRALKYACVITDIDSGEEDPRWMTPMRKQLIKDAPSILQALEEAVSLVGVMREALEWYSLGGRYSVTAHMDDAGMVDGGKRARQTLSQAAALGFSNGGGEYVRT